MKTLVTINRDLCGFLFFKSILCMQRSGYNMNDYGRYVNRRMPQFDVANTHTQMSCAHTTTKIKSYDV